MRNLVIKTGVIVMSFWLWNCLGPRPENLGLTNGKLLPCPDTPNCVSSLEDQGDTEHYIHALKYEGDAGAAMNALKNIVKNYPRTTIVKETEGYLHVEFTTAIMRYTDDVEFALDTAMSVIHVRSASRIGHSDLGANRNRIEEIRELFGRNGE